MKPNRINFLMVPFALAIFLYITPAANCQSTDNIPEISISNLPITEAIKTFARQGGINFIIDPKLFMSPGGSISEPTVTISWTNVSASEGLARLLKENNLVMSQDKFTTVTLITDTNHVPNVVDASLLGSESTNGVSMFHFQDVPLPVALKTLIESAHINAVLDPKVSDYIDPNDPTMNKFHNAPMVSLRWEQLTARQAIVALCETYNLTIVKDPTGEVRIKPKNS